MAIFIEFVCKITPTIGFKLYEKLYISILIIVKLPIGTAGDKNPRPLKLKDLNESI